MKKIYTPSNLDLREFFPDLPESELDRYYYIIHLIYEQRILYKNPEEFVPLKAIYLRNIIRDYNYYRDILIDHDILLCDGKYVRGVKSMGYRLAGPYSKVKHKQRILTNKFILKSLEKWRKSRLPTTEVHLHLFEFLSKLEINYPEALQAISGLPVEEYNPSRIAIDKFLEKDFFFVKDKSDRVHTNVTSLKSDLRKFLTYNRQRLVNVDITNSQPLILLCLLQNHSTTPSIRCTFLNYLENGEMDILKYKSLVEFGELYTYLMDNCDIKDRDTLKETVFKEIFFGKIRKGQSYLTNKISSVFKELFPTVAKILGDAKAKDYKTLAWMMQKAESDLIINKVCRRIMEENRECFISTIHDSILTTAEHGNMVKAIMTEEFKKIGLLPHIRIEVA